MEMVAEPGTNQSSPSVDSNRRLGGSNLINHRVGELQSDSVMNPRSYSTVQRSSSAART